MSRGLRYTDDSMWYKLTKLFIYFKSHSFNFQKPHSSNLQTLQVFKGHITRKTVLTFVSSILTWGSISGRRRSWPSPTPGEGAHHQESHKRTDGDVEGKHLLRPGQTGSHQKQLPTVGKLGTSVRGHGGGWALRRSQHQCSPVLGLEERQNERGPVAVLY